MFDFIKQRFKAGALGSRLPPDVETAISSITINVRQYAVEETESPERIIVFGLAGSPFIATYQGIKRRIEWAFPELNDRQVNRAVQWVQAEITNRLRESAGSKNRNGSGWLHNW